jgi:hypothetical protein
VKVNLRVTNLEGENRDLVAEFGALCRYEQHTGKSVLTWKQNTPGVYDFAVMAWIVETSQAIPFEEWTDSVGMVVMTGFEEVNPTKPGASPG